MSAHGFLILALLASTASAFVIPLLNPRRSNDTIFEDSFTSEPKGRGTVTLLTSCFLTFGLCVWTSVHPNIIHCSGGKGQLRFKLLWMVAAIFFPEIVMMCALGERRRAEKVALDCNKEFEKTAKGNGSGTEYKPKMSLAAGFFVEMGGFTAKDGQGKTFTFTADGFTEYVRLGRITEDMVNIQSIYDKGNASGFTKLITFLQALWFIFRCGSRWYQGFPVTLLERHVAIQVLFTLFTCIFWWYKPLDVICPINITLLSPMNKSSSIDVAPLSPTNESPSMDVTPLSPTNESPSMDETLLLPTDLKLREDASHKDPRRPMDSEPAPPYESIYYTGTRKIVYEDHPPRLSNLLTKGVYDTLKYVITEHIGDMFWIFILLLSNGLWHLFAWDVDFPTLWEETLWAVSCLIMCGSALIFSWLGSVPGFQQFFLGVLWEVQFIRKKPVRGAIALFRHLMEINKFQSWKKFLILIMWVLYLIYTSAVIFILVECIISVRRLAKGSYAIAPLTGSKSSGGLKNFW